MTQPAYDVLSEKRRLESAGLPAEQAEAILESVTRATTVNEKWERKLDHVQGSVTRLEADVGALKTDVSGVKVGLGGVKVGLGGVKVGLGGVKAEMATKKDVEAAVAVLRADMYRALWVQGLSLGTLILGLAVLVATAAEF
ncbi:MAG: hypothetical protein OXG29_02745 [Gammaproteobacteria bacterium]|nr:hypothetical protein [Gammaproteobacteria bacterium]